MLIDYHVHNHFSPDSKEDTAKIIQKALEIGLKEICITNHAELHDKATGKSIFDGAEARSRFREIKAEIDRFQLITPNLKIKFGVELEYVEGRMEELKKFVEETDFDFVLGSVHIVKDIIISSKFFAEELYSKTDEETAYNSYFESLMKLVEWGHFDVVAHFDINKKIGHKFYGSFDPEKYKDRILPILNLMAERGIGLELNTKCIQEKCCELFPHPTILKWAVEADIKHFTLGSDAHSAELVGQHFEGSLKIAEGAGIKNVSTYSRRSPSLHKL